MIPILYFLPLVVVVVISPKLFSMYHITLKDFRNSVVKRKHVLIAIIVGLIPLVNIALSMISVTMYAALFTEHLTKDEGWLDKPFKTKRNRD